MAKQLKDNQNSRQYDSVMIKNRRKTKSEHYANTMNIS